MKQMPWFDKATYLSLFFKFNLSERLSNSLCALDVLPFLEFIKVASILYYNCIEFVVLLHSFLVIHFSQSKEFKIWQISFSTFSDVLPAFTSTSVISNLFIFLFFYFLFILIFIQVEVCFNKCTISNIGKNTVINAHPVV